MKRLLNLFAIGLLLAACDMEQQEPQVKVQSTYSVECASYDFTDESGVLTKSVIGVDKSGSDGSQKVSNWNIWVYDHSTGNIVNNGGKNIYNETMKTFFTETSGIDGDLLFPDENGHYDIYILTNVEKITSVPATASAAAAYGYTFDNYNSFMPENGGFPMAAVYSNFCPATADSHTFMVKRLVSKYSVVIVNDIPDSKFILSSVKLMQGAKKINPFQENSKIFSKTEAGERFDYFSVSELKHNELETGQSLTGELYMLENNQGQVFNSTVSTDKERIPKKMINPQNGELCTFVEFTGDIKMKDEHGQNNIKFRHYFGSGRNAGVMRNINTTVTLTLKSCPNDSDEDWRIEPEDPYDTRTVVFNPNPVNIVANGSWYDVTVTPKGGDPLVLNNYIEYRLECPDASSASLSFDGVTMGSTVKGQKTLRIKSNYSGSIPKTVILEAKSTTDNLALGSLPINVSAYVPEPDEFFITIVEYVKDSKICIRAILSESCSTNINFSYSYAAYTGSPSHSYAEQAGMPYIQLLNTRYGASSDNKSGAFIIPAGTTDFTFETTVCANNRFFKRQVAQAVHGYPADKTVIQVHIKDYSYDSDEFLTVVNSGSGGGSEHVATCLGIFKYGFLDYSIVPNPNISTNYNRTAYFNITSDLATYPTLKDSFVTFELVKANDGSVIDTKYIQISDFSTKIEFSNSNNSGNGFSIDDVGGTYIRVASYSLNASNGDYYLMQKK